jgi:hypothetical protein
MAAFLNLEGQQFGALKVLERASSVKGETKWICQCDCGNVLEIFGKALRRGFSTSCGCYRREVSAQRLRTHGLSHTPEFGAWERMRNRCRNPASPDYADYGARGINVSPEWDKFEQFYTDMGPRPSGRHSVGRKDNDGPYCASNCRWETPVQQANNKRSNRILQAFGKEMTLAEWGRETGYGEDAISARLKLGWSVERALSTPIRRRAL